MNVTVWILLGELLCVSLALLIFQAIARWRKRKRLLTELAELLERVNRSEPGRQLGLQARLMEHFGLDEDEAESLSIEIMRAERSLFKTFTEIQFGGDLHQIGDFDKCVYGLLDKYWDLLSPESFPKIPDSPNLDGTDFDPEIAEYTEKTDRNSGSGHFEDTFLEDYPGSSDTEDDLAEPTWDDAFEEIEQGQTAGETVDQPFDDTEGIRSSD